MIALLVQRVIGDSVLLSCTVAYLLVLQGGIGGKSCCEWNKIVPSPVGLDIA